MSREEYLHIPHDFPGRSGEAGNSGSGNPPSQQSDWERLSAGRTIGKSVNVLYIDSLTANDRAPQNMLEIRGEDWQALQLSLLLSPPKFAAKGSFTQNTVANVQGFQDYRDLVGNIVVGLANPGVIVEWGIGGISNKVEVDIATGCQLNLGGASFVRVQAFVERGAVGATDLIYNLSGFINPGQCKSVGATKTVPVGLVLNGNDSAVKAIPKFARGVTIQSAQQWVGEVIFCATGDGTSILGDALFSFNMANSGYIPIPNGAYFFFIRSSAPIGNGFSAIFDLAL